jgi:hypothetical protein
MASSYNKLQSQRYYDQSEGTDQKSIPFMSSHGGFLKTAISCQGATKLKNWRFDLDSILDCFVESTRQRSLDPAVVARFGFMTDSISFRRLLLHHVLRPFQKGIDRRMLQSAKSRIFPSMDELFFVESTLERRLTQMLSLI